MENKELEPVEEVVDVVAESNTLGTAMKVGGVILGITAIAGLGYIVVKKIKARRMETMNSIEYSEVNPQDEETEE